MATATGGRLSASDKAGWVRRSAVVAGTA
jgi:hypothetical protein